MSSVSPLNSGGSWDQMMALQGAGGPTDDTQGTRGANDAFAALFAQMMAAKQEKAATDPAATGTSQAGAAGASAASATGMVAPVATGATSQAMADGNVSAAQLAFQSKQADQKPHHHFWNFGSQDASATGSTGAASAAAAEANGPDLASAASAMATTDPQMRSLLMGLT